ncbi:hypothetical protein WH50_02495 [Pokkaliibacter plantistimulans]|uniref:Uncharacterized protein n=1 Tax=Pokkaliibacter plantistimulans TaxID=1635171 RepID=A0ABX5M1M6_9GAMM|nr:hypothetical protein WH50_02495 [Pokkaliibacter plantistimulans]
MPFRRAYINITNIHLPLDQPKLLINHFIIGYPTSTPDCSQTLSMCGQQDVLRRSACRQNLLLLWNFRVLLAACYYNNKHGSPQWHIEAFFQKSWIGIGIIVHGHLGK